MIEVEKANPDSTLTISRIHSTYRPPSCVASSRIAS